MTAVLSSELTLEARVDGTLLFPRSDKQGKRPRLWFLVRPSPATDDCSAPRSVSPQGRHTLWLRRERFRKKQFLQRAAPCARVS